MNTKSVKKWPLVIVGSGPAACSAAIYSCRAAINTLMIAGFEPGGQLMITTDVENYPGFASTVQGPDLMQAMQQQAQGCGAQLQQTMVTRVDFSARPFRLWCDDASELLADSVIIATGARARWLQIPGETDLRGHGVSACATCDAFFFRNQQVAVIGGGNTAAEEALFLTKFATKVTLIHRRDSLRAEKILQQRVMANEKISVLWNKRVTRFLGSQQPPVGLTGIELTDTVTAATSNLAVSGAFVAIGHIPATELVRDQLRLDTNGYIETAISSTCTSVPGVFAAGDVMDARFRQAVTAAGFGCMAALEADAYLHQGSS